MMMITAARWAVHVTLTCALVLAVQVAELDGDLRWSEVALICAGGWLLTASAVWRALAMEEEPTCP